MQALGERVRLVAQEDRGFLLDLARARLTDHVGSRLFFNSDPLPRLRYDEKVFSVVVSNLTWWERADRAELLAEIARVLDDEATIILTAPLAGSFGEIVDLTREVIVKLDLAARLEPRVAALEALFATPEDWVTEVESVGLVRARVDCTEVELRFASSRELFSSTPAQARWLGLWRHALGDECDRLLWHVRQMIDGYWADSKFPLTLLTGCLVAHKPPAARTAAAKEGPAARHVEAAAPAPADAACASGAAIADDLLRVRPEAGPGAERPISLSPDALRPITIAPEALHSIAPLPERARPAPESAHAQRPISLAPEALRPLDADADEADTIEGEPVEAEPIEAEPVEAEPIEAEPIEDDSLEPEAIEPEAVGAEPDQPEPWGAEDLHVPAARPGPGTAERRPAPADAPTPVDAAPPAARPAFPLPAAPADFPTDLDLTPPTGPPLVSPVPLAGPHAAPVRPVDLGTPQIRPLAPVDLREPLPEAEPDEILPDWEDEEK
jgi:SAM-dependent methyltransferase